MSYIMMISTMGQRGPRLCIKLHKDWNHSRGKTQYETNVIRICYVLQVMINAVAILPITWVVICHILACIIYRRCVIALIRVYISIYPLQEEYIMFHALYATRYRGLSNGILQLSKNVTPTPIIAHFIHEINVSQIKFMRCELLCVFPWPWLIGVYSFLVTSVSMPDKISSAKDWMKK